MRGSGKFSAPNKALAPFEVGRAIAGKEIVELRWQVIVSDSIMETELFRKTEFFFAQKSQDAVVVAPIELAAHATLLVDDHIAKTDRFTCDINGCSVINCSSCSNHRCCGNCLGAIFENLCTDCIRSISSA